MHEVVITIEVIRYQSARKLAQDMVYHCDGYSGFSGFSGFAATGLSAAFFLRSLASALRIARLRKGRAGCVLFRGESGFPEICDEFFINVQRESKISTMSVALVLPNLGGG
jgi:hypothetical protein